MTITYSAADPNFDSDLYAMLTWFEDNVSYVYADSKGYATIGVGFLVSANAPAILSNMGLGLSQSQINAAAVAITAATQGVNFGTGSAGDLAAQNAINNALNTSTGSTGLVFQFSSDTQIFDTFNAIIVNYETTVKQWLPSGITIPNDLEMIALVSLAYNGFIGKNKYGNWKSPALRNAIADGNRAEAWYQIGYNTPGPMARNYAQAALFGLYDPSDTVNGVTTVPQAEAVQIYQTLSQYIPKMAATDAANTSALNTASNWDNPLAYPQDLQTTLNPARDALLGWIASQYNVTLDPSINSTDIQLASSSRPNLTAWGGPELLVGEGQGGGITGSTGNDTMVAGTSGDQVFYGEGGSDTYIISSAQTGTDTIHDTVGTGEILVDGAQVTAQAAVYQGNNKWVDGSTNYLYDSSKGTLTISGGGSETIVIDNFDLNKALYPAQGYLGIQLQNYPSITAGASPSGFASTDQNVSNPYGSSQEFTISLAGAIDQVQTLRLSLAEYLADQAWELINGAQKLSFNPDGTIDITIPAGQTGVSLALVDTSGNSTADTATLSVTLLDANGNPVTDASGAAISSNNLDVTFEQPGLATSNVTPDYSIYGNFAPKLDANGNYQYDPMGNLITDPNTPAPNTMGTGGHKYGDALLGSTTGNDLIVTGEGTLTSVYAGNGNNTIHGGSGVDIISAGDGDNVITGGGEASVSVNSKFHDIIGVGSGKNQIYADTQVDLATALANQKTAQATGQKGTFFSVGGGTNTIVGGNGNDLMFTGHGGSNTVVMGAGKNTFVGGVDVSSVVDWWGTYNHQLSGTTIYNSGTNTVVDWWNSGNGSPNTGNAVWGVLATSTGVTDSTDYQGNRWLGVSIAQQWQGADNYITMGTVVSGGTPFGKSNDTIYGGTGNSIYYLSNGDNWIDAGGGNDQIFAGTGRNTIYGGTGNDTILGAGGSNFINLESGNDVVIAHGGNQTIIGGSGNNILVSGDEEYGWNASETSSNNYIYGGSGNTTIFGSGGNDTLISGSTSGTAESIWGGDGNEYIVGGNGADTIYGGAGQDTIYAGDGNTSIQLSTSTAESSTVYGGNGNNTIIGGNGTDVISTGDGNTVVYAGTGTSSIFGGAGNDTLVGGSGTDLMVAGTGNSLLQGGSGTETMYASIGNATLIAGSGDDTLYGGGGTDVLQGADGNTTFYAGTGNETITGGTGNNTYIFNPGMGNITLVTNPDAASNTFVFGPGVSAADLTLTATAGDPPLLIQDSYGGSVVIDGGLDASINNFSFSDGSVLSLAQLMAQAYTVPTTIAEATGNVVFSADVNDTLVGGAGNDSLYGWGTDQTLIAGTGVTTLVGGAGNDTFIVNNSADVARELSDSGYSIVNSSVNYSMADQAQAVHDLTLTGTADLAGSGNDLNNVITANSGNDTLSGGGGDDTLIGGAGLDTFMMSFDMGTDTVVDSSTQGGIVHLGSGLPLSDLLAIKQGNDLLLQIAGSADSKMLIKDYYSNTQTAWTLQDDAGNTVSVQQLLDATPTTSWAGNLGQVESDFMSKAKTGIVQGLWGYTLQPDGTWTSSTSNVSQPEAWSNPYYTLTVQHNISFINGQAAQSYTTKTYWDPTNVNNTITESAIQVQLSRVVSDSSVINAQPSSVSGTTTDIKWAPVYWWYQYGTYSTYQTQTVQVRDSQGNLIGYDHQSITLPRWYSALAFTSYYDSATNSLSNTVTPDMLLNSPGNLTTTGSYPQAVPIYIDYKVTADTIQQVYVADGNHTVNGGGQWTVVNGGAGSDVISNAGLVYTGQGNDTVSSSGTVYCGSGNDEVLNARNVYSGSGLDTIFNNSTNYMGTSTFVDANVANVIVGGDNPTYLLPNSIQGNDYAALAPYYQNIISSPSYQYFAPHLNTVTFGEGVSLSDLSFSWGQIEVVMNATDPASKYTTLNISWGTNGQTVQVIIPHSDEPAGSGVSVFSFADGTRMSIADMIALAPPAPTFDPQLVTDFTFQSGMGAQTLPTGITTIQIASGIAPSSISVTQNSQGGFLVYDNNGSSLTIPSLASIYVPIVATFADGSSWQFVNANGGTYTYATGSTVYLASTGAPGILQFATGITPDMITLGVGSLMLRVGGNDGVIHIEGFNPNDALNSGEFQSFKFADGTTLSYADLLARGFDIYGTTGNETLTGTNLDNRIYAGTGDDVLIGSGAHDTLYGGVGSDTLIGGGGPELMVAGNGLTTMIGGTGDNTFVVNNVNDVVQAQSTGTNVNTIETSVDYTASPNVQNLTGTGTADLTLTGNDLNNVITANSGNDTLIGAGGIDTLTGGTGSDTFVVDNVNDVVQAVSTGTNVNTIETSVDYTASVNVQNLTGIGGADIILTGNDLNNVIAANSGNDTLIGAGGIDTLIGGGGNDTFVVNNVNDVVQAASTGSNVNTIETSVYYTASDNVQNLTGTGTADLTLTGNNLDNVITANSGNDTLDGGLGADTLIGGTGSDTFVVDNVNDVVQAVSTGTNVNTIETSVDYTAPANVQNLTGIGNADIVLTGNGLNNVITANSGNDTLIGAGGIDTLIGGVGNDTFVVDNVNDVVQAQSIGSNINTVLTSVSYVAPENVQDLTGIGGADIVLTGNGLDNVITANSGNDTLIATGGIDTLIGGVGNDTFIVDNSADVVQAQLTGSNINTVKSSVDYSLATQAPNVQNLIGTGSADLTLTGNSLDNVITANNSNDTLISVGGNDTLVSGTGVDTMIGGAGNDTFIVNNSADLIQAQLTGSNVNTALSSVSYDMGTNAQNVQNLTGTGSADLVLTGNSLDNTIVANSGNDLLNGGTGNDTLIGGTGADVLEGGTGNDSLTDTQGQGILWGGAGNDILTGGGGNSFFAGGAGNDIITPGIMDSVVAFNVGDGADTIVTGAGGNNTLSLGGPVDFRKMSLSRNGNDLILNLDASDSITFQDWYASGANNDFTTLQIMGGQIQPNNTTMGQRMSGIANEFDFIQIVDKFDKVTANKPPLSQWNMTDAMVQAHLSSSDTAALGGDLAYYYGTQGAFTGMNLTSAQTVINDPQFGTQAQTLNSNVTGGTVTL